MVSQDVNFSSVDSSVSCSWEGFSDPESGIVKYEVQTLVNEIQAHSYVLDGTQLVSHVTSVTVRNGYRIQSRVTAFNGAEMRQTVYTNGYLVDKTPPRLVCIGIENATPGKPYYQSNSTSITASWEFKDPESGIDHYMFKVIKLRNGIRVPGYPPQGWSRLVKDEVNCSDRQVISRLSLENGGIYAVNVKAVNRANLETTYASQSLTVDTTPPIVNSVSQSGSGVSRIHTKLETICPFLQRVLSIDLSLAGLK